nr:MAG TPA: hypothetical protein [Caudoviricetes sp.]
MIPFGFTPFLYHFTIIVSLSCITYLIISLPPTYFLLLYHICDINAKVTNQEFKYLQIICIGGIFTSTN